MSQEQLGISCEQFAKNLEEARPMFAKLWEQMLAEGHPLTKFEPKKKNILQRIFRK
jgi:hypothetical protein